MRSKRPIWSTLILRRRQDNARALVVYHDPVTREVQFNDRLLAFAKHWAFLPRACAPYRARTKGKDERGVGYVKHNALAGRAFASFAALEAHLEQWVREIADVRVHGTTGEAPAVRFAREAAALKSVARQAAVYRHAAAAAASGLLRRSRTQRV